MVEYLSVSSGATEGSSNTRKLHAPCTILRSCCVCDYNNIFCFCFTDATTSLTPSAEQPIATAGSSSQGICNCLTTLVEQRYR